MELTETDSLQPLNSWGPHLGACRWLWVGNASTFLKDGDESGVVHLIFFFMRQPPTGLSVIGCRAIALLLAPERGNGSVQPFTSQAFRLTESIRQDQALRFHTPIPFLSGLYTS